MSNENKIRAHAPISEARFLFDIGSDVEDALKIHVLNGVDRVQITLNDEAPAYLNFRALQFCAADGSVVSIEGDIFASRSNKSANPTYRYSSKAATAYHSDLVLRPEYTVRFDSPSYIDSILICNRGGRWGRRLLNLSVTAFSKNKVVMEFSNFSSERFAASMAQLRRLKEATGYFRELLVSNKKLSALFSKFFDLSFQEICESDAAEIINSYRDEILTSIISSPPNRSDRIEIAELLMRMTNRLGDHPRPGSDVRMLAMAIALTMDFGPLTYKGKSLGDEMVKWNAFFPKPEDLIYLQNQVEKEFIAIGGIGKPVVSRHGWRVAPLTAQKDAYIDLLRKICRRLEEKQLQPFLSYGTLLGARRNGHFIPFDDDADVAISIPCSIGPELNVFMRDLATQLQSDGFKCAVDEAYSIIQVGGPGISTGVDIFPVAEKGSGVKSMLHRGMKFSEVEAELLFPRSVGVLEGVEFPTPGRIDEFLEWRYGKSWMTPDQFFEMEWIFSY